MNKIIAKVSNIVCLTALVVGTATLSPTSARADWFTCNPTEVIEVGSRVHVRCSNSITFGSDVVRYVAISKSNADQAARFISFGNAAFLSGKSFRVDIPRSSATNTAGCATNDCRTPVAFGVM